MDIDSWLAENPFSPEVNAKGLPPAMEEPDTVETRFSISPDPENMPFRPEDSVEPSTMPYNQETDTTESTPMPFDIDQFLKDNPFRADVPTSGDTRQIGTADQMLPPQPQSEQPEQESGGSFIPQAVAGLYGLNRAVSGGVKDYLKKEALFGAFDDSPREELTEEQMQEELTMRAMDAVTPIPLNISKVAVGKTKDAFEKVARKMVSPEDYGLRGLKVKYLDEMDDVMKESDAAGMAKKGSNIIRVVKNKNKFLQDWVESHEKGHYLYEDLQNITVADMMSKNENLWDAVKDTSAVKSHQKTPRGSDVLNHDAEGVDWVEAMADMYAESKVRPEAYNKDAKDFLKQEMRDFRDYQSKQQQGLVGLSWDDVKDEFRGMLPRQGQVGDEIANLSPRTKNRLFREQDPQVTKGYTPKDYFEVLKDDPWFTSLKDAKPNGEGVFDQLKIMSEVERAYAPGARPNKYSTGLGVKGSTTAKTRQSAAIDIQSSNAKTGDSEILSSDTIRGCGNNCNTCFANTGCGQSKIAHNEPVPAKLKGKVKEGQILRVGTNGDPAIDWSHSNKEISEVFDRSKGSVSPETNLFGITKLQSIEGFDPAIWKNLEVSLDPLNPDHMRITMANIQRLKKMNPDINISARIRSFKSKNPALQKSQDQAVQFANQHGLEILETKMRFKNKEYEDILDLDKNAYKGKGAQRVYDGESILKETNPDAQKKITVCGEGATEGQCITCRGCEKVGTKTLSKDWKATPEYIEEQISKGAITGDDIEKARKAVR